MLTEAQLDSIRGHLERAQNPIFFFDNDADGLCSFLILRRFLDRGKGVAVRSFPDLNGSYARKISELNADYVFILDKPVLSRDFLAEVSNLNLPIVWIDHHDLPIADFEKEFENLSVFNPARNEGQDKSFEPVTYLVHQVARRSEDLWLALMGCIADHFLPDFSKEFEEKYPEFWKADVSDPFEAYFGTELGEIAQALNFGLKDSVSNVVKMQNYLIGCKGPGDVLAENPGNYFFRKKYYEIKKKYDSLLNKSKKSLSGKVLFFDYSGDLSISADLSNRLSFLYPGVYIAVAYRKEGISNLSLRGPGVKKVLEIVLKEVPGIGGGHDDAVGARISSDDLLNFKTVFERVVNERS